MAEKNPAYSYKLGDLVWAKMPSYCFWPGRIVEPNTPAIAKLKKSPTQWCVFFFGSNNYGWIEEKSLRPYNEFRDEMKSKGKPKDQFQLAMNDIESFIDNPDGFSALFEPKTPIPKKKASPKPKKSQDLELDFDSLKSDSSVPSSPVVVAAVKTPALKRSISAKSSEKERPKVAEKTPKVPAAKRKATKESESEEASVEVVAPPPVKKPRKSSQAPIQSPPRVESAPKQKSPRAPVEPSGIVFGFIGLGTMGTTILDNILLARHEVVIWNRSISRCDEFVERYGSLCTVVASPKEVFEQSQITFICVSDTDAVKETIIAGENAVIAAENMTHDKGLVMLSSIDTETSRDVTSALMMRGPVRYLEAHIQGSKLQARDGRLIVIASGDESLYQDCESCFKSISKDSYYLGEETEDSIKMNLVLQTVAGVQLAAVSEAMALADTFELQLRDILEIISISNLSSEFIFEKGDVIISENFREPSMKVDTMQKDLRMAIEFGDSLQQPLPLATASNEIFKSAKRLGLGQNDCASIYFASNLKTDSNSI